MKQITLKKLNNRTKIRSVQLLVWRRTDKLHFGYESGFSLQNLHFDYKSCVSFTNIQLSVTNISSGITKWHLVLLLSTSIVIPNSIPTISDNPNNYYIYDAERGIDSLLHINRDPLVIGLFFCYS
jgi:hypothetical protein